jgi:hypothetical protein
VLLGKRSKSQRSQGRRGEENWQDTGFDRSCSRIEGSNWMCRRAKRRGGGRDWIQRCRCRRRSEDGCGSRLLCLIWSGHFVNYDCAVKGQNGISMLSRCSEEDALTRRLSAFAHPCQAACACRSSVCPLQHHLTCQFFTLDDSSQDIHPLNLPSIL